MSASMKVRLSIQTPQSCPKNHWPVSMDPHLLLVHRAASSLHCWEQRQESPAFNLDDHAQLSMDEASGAPQIHWNVGPAQKIPRSYSCRSTNRLCPANCQESFTTGPCGCKGVTVSLCAYYSSLMTFPEKSFDILQAPPF